MLTLLKINNLALVEDLTWEVGSGLVGVTGETGAGKSVIVGALKLVLGERADRGLLRTGCDTCSVEAVFELTDAAEVNAVLAGAGLEPCEGGQLVVRRVIGRRCGNRQFVNCSPVTLTVLKELGRFLVDLHGAHDHQSLLSRERQRAMLDAYAGAAGDAGAYDLALQKWRSLQREHDELANAERANEQEIDLLVHQIDEIGSADIQPDEQGELERRYQLANNSSLLLELAGGISAALSGDGGGSIVASLSELARQIRELEKHDPGVSEFTGAFDTALVELEELGHTLRNYSEGLELDPSALAEMETRLDLLESLKRKYGNTLEDVVLFRQQAQDKLARIEGRGEELERLAASAAAARTELESRARKLAAKRRRAAPRLARAIAAHLHELGFERAHFEIALETLDAPAPGGGEAIDFMFSPNPGEVAKPLRLIASSGEISRVMLAAKCALARQDSIPLMVFDEIDANVGGEIAQAVGAKMAALGTSHQVISITHLPQVASLAECHYVVSKEFGDDGRTRSRLSKITGKRRIGEIARMLGGGAKSARQHAENLLSVAA